MKHVKLIIQAAAVIISISCGTDDSATAGPSPLVNLTQQCDIYRGKTYSHGKFSFFLPDSFSLLPLKVFNEAKSSFLKTSSSEFSAEILSVWNDGKNNSLIVFSKNLYFDEKNDLQISHKIMQTYKNGIEGCAVFRDFHGNTNCTILQIAVELKSIVLYKFIFYTPHDSYELSFIIQKSDMIRQKSLIAGIVLSGIFQR